MSHQTWFVPLANLLNEDGANLIPASDLDAGQWIEPGSPFTISLESFCIASRLDKRTGNDLLVRSWSIYGDDPPSKIVHFFKKNLPAGYVGENLAIEHLYAANSYDAQPLEIILQILEVDGDASVADDIKLVSGLFGAVFPAILPVVGVASGLISRLKGIKKNDKAFERSIQFCNRDQMANASAEEGVVKLPLRSGAHILFTQDVTPDQYRLRELKLEGQDTASQRRDYVVLKVIPRVINSLNQEDLLANQRLAMALFRTGDEDPNCLPPRIRDFRRPEPLKRLKTDLRKAELWEELSDYLGTQDLIESLDSSAERLKEKLDAQDTKFQAIVSKIKQYL